MTESAGSNVLLVCNVQRDYIDGAMPLRDGTRVLAEINHIRRSFQFDFTFVTTLTSLPCDRWVVGSQGVGRQLPRAAVRSASCDWHVVIWPRWCAVVGGHGGLWASPTLCAPLTFCVGSPALQPPPPPPIPPPTHHPQPAPPSPGSSPPLTACGCAALFYGEPLWGDQGGDVPGFGGGRPSGARRGGCRSQSVCN